MNYQTAYDRAFALLADDQTFASKTAQKDALRYLNTAYNALRRADRDEQLDKCEDMADADRYGFLEHYDLPFDLHQLRDKHNFLCHDRAEKARNLFSLRETFKGFAVNPRPVSATAAMKEQEKKIGGAVRDSGFRAPGFSTEFHYCSNTHGTVWYRMNWYQDGRLVSFADAQTELARLHDIWVRNGSPFMGGWSYDAKKKFFQEG
jgi:hypothetical protein